MLPLFGDFLRSEAGHAAVLQLSDWRHERLAAGRYLCFAPRATLLGWTVAPALELEVVSSPGASSAAVHLLRTTLAGSQAVEAQSRRLHAVGLHTISWTEGAGAPVLRSAVELTVDLAVEGPLALFSGAAIAAPGSLFLRRVIRRSLVESKFLASLETAYREWERAAAPGTSDV